MVLDSLHKKGAVKEGTGARFLVGEVLRSSPQGIHLRMTFEGTSWEIDSPLVGAHNASNLLAVQALALGLGELHPELAVTPEDFLCFEGFGGVSGRLERMANPTYAFDKVKKRLMSL